MLYIVFAKTNLQHWGKPLGSTPLFIILVGHYCNIIIKMKKQILQIAIAVLISLV